VTRVATRDLAAVDRGARRRAAEEQESWEAIAIEDAMVRVKVSVHESGRRPGGSFRLKGDNLADILGSIAPRAIIPVGPPIGSA
jgi:hypothetical protein